MKINVSEKKKDDIFGYLLMLIDFGFVSLSRFVVAGTVDSGLYGLLFIVVVIENTVFLIRKLKKRSKKE